MKGLVLQDTVEALWRGPAGYLGPSSGKVVEVSVLTVENWVYPWLVPP